jgi:hypothetical protein
MFASIDTFASDVREYIAGSIGAGDCGHIAPTLAIIRYDMQADSAILRAMDRKLLTMAREAAAEGYAAPQDRAIRVGVRVAGCGAIEATIRHNGEHVVVVVGLDAKSFPNAPNAPEALRLAALEACARMDAERNDRYARACRAHAARIYRQSRLTAGIHGRLERAARVPGTAEAGAYESWQRKAGHAEVHRIDANGSANRLLAERHRLAAEPAPCECCGVRPQAVPAGDCGGGVVMWCEACHRDGGAE